MTVEFCPMHSGDDVTGVPVEDAPGALRFSCTRRDHPGGRSYEWLRVPPPPGVADLSEAALSLHLDVGLPAALQQFSGRWVEYGVLEAAYAAHCPGDFAELVSTYGHNAVRHTPYTASAFLAATLGHLGRAGLVEYHDGPATGDWSYNSSISWWALPPAPDWEPENQISWASTGGTRDYAKGRS